MREAVPWWARIAAKLVLSRLPAGYDFWRARGFFAHGSMHRADYALRVFKEHFDRAGVPSGQPFVALELGPGDSLSSALVAAAFGATQTYLIDAGRFAALDPQVYRDMARHLAAQGLPAPALEDVRDVEGLLRACRASYGTEGLRSLRSVPSASVDFIWSNAVLEHIRRAEFADFMRETRRVLKNSGRCSHQVDLRDHLGGALNNLRIASSWWETSWMANSGFYTNRLRMSEITQVFASCGFAVDIVAQHNWPQIPTSPERFAPEFRGLSEEDLLVSDFAAVLKPT